MLNATFRPLDQWPGVRTTGGRRDATFRATYLQTLDLLEHELSKLRAKEIIIQVEGLTSDDVRNDGRPRAAGWKNGYGGPSVIVSFESPKGAISMPCDKFRDWQDNLRAIAKSLEALRMVDRYGVTRGNEQYRGWAKLEAPKNGKMTRAEAIAFLASLHRTPSPDIARLDTESLRSICRTAKIENHPDRGGSHEIFVKIGQAEVALLEGR
jgi:hypothetical protein